MNVEQENFLRAIFASVQRVRRRSGTSRVMARAKSALIDDGVGAMVARVRADADGAAAFEEDFLDVLAE